MSFTKLKAISHSLCKALGIPLCCTFTKIRFCVLQRLELYSRLPFIKKYFIFLKWFFRFIRRHLTGTINRGEGWERTVQREEFRTHYHYKHKKLLMKKYYWINRGVWLYLLLLLHYTIIQFLTIVFTSVSKSTN